MHRTLSEDQGPPQEAGHAETEGLDTMAKVMIAMSGGVDSSVAAALLKDEGHDVVGVTMSIWDRESVAGLGTHNCCSGPGQGDAEDAREIARVLGIPFHVFDLSDEFNAEVLDHVRREYMSGRTPNPCIRCNRLIKLDGLVARAREAGVQFDWVATGHYARAGFDSESGRHHLRRARDLTKDQTYFLFSLSQAQLGRLMLPLGDYTKQEIRAIAAGIKPGLDSKRESQDFIAGGYSSILRTAVKPGPILDRKGNVLGQHRGIPYYTVGQRRGLGLPLKRPHYVIEIDVERNAVIVGTKGDAYGDELICSELNWIAIEGLGQPIELKAKIRYSHAEADATVVPIGEGKARVKFAAPQMAITPGQAVVFYDGDLVVGGGTIERAKR